MKYCNILFISTLLFTIPTHTASLQSSKTRILGASIFAGIGALAAFAQWKKGTSKSSKKKIDTSRTDEAEQKYTIERSWKPSKHMIQFFKKHNLDVNNINGTDIKNRDQLYWQEATALIWAADEENLAIVKELIKAGARLDEESRSGYTALTLAVRRKNHAIVKELINGGADVHKQNNRHGPYRGMTALMWAAHNGDCEIARMLIAARPEQKEKINLHDGDGQTALIYAVKLHHLEMVDELIAAGANVDIKDIPGMTALMYAIKTKSFDIVRKLIKAGAQVNLTDKYGWTPLMYAIEWYPCSIEELLEAGADDTMKSTWRQSYPDFRNVLVYYKENTTALDIAKRKPDYADINNRIGRYQKKVTETVQSQLSSGPARLPQGVINIVNGYVLGESHA